MQDFHCNYIKNKCGGRADKSFTDSLMYKIETENVYVMKTSTKSNELFLTLGMIQKICIIITIQIT